MKKQIALIGLVAALAVAFATVSYAAEVTPIAANVQASAAAVIREAKCGGTITTGSPIYLDPNDGGKAKAAAQTSLTTAAVVGLAIGACEDEQQIRYVVEDPDYTPGMTLVEGQAYCLGHGATGGAGTAGGIGECRLFSAVTPVPGSTGTYAVQLFTASSTTKAKVKIVVPASAY